MHSLRTFVSLACVLLLTSCGWLHTKGNRAQIAAEPLKPAANAIGATPLERAHDLMQDSEDKCARYIQDMYLSSAFSNTSLDILTTSFTAVATVFKNLNTVHSLTAAGTITSGTKASIQSNFLNALTLNQILQATQSTYSTKKDAYINYLNSQTSVDVVAERSTIQGIHSLCSLTSAIGSINASITPSGTTRSSGLISLTYNIDATVDKTANDIAQHVREKINADQVFIAAGIAAKPDMASPTVNADLKRYGKLSSMTWKDAVVSAGASFQASVSGSSITFTVTAGAKPVTGESVTVRTDALTPVTDQKPSVISGEKIQ